ncbi:MAG: 30S ribosomal protein S24e [Candidatus Aenigmarchaeota archaeon ex4484_52]|nr:MAG: 30S ribosomal protein S24e [Candidatus Aenigmarchaeota archaeon ex4484_52]
MELIKIKEKNNPLLNRVEIVFEINSNGPTPKKQEVVDKIADFEKKTKENIFVVKIKQEFGKTTSIAHAYIYDSKEKVLKRKKKDKKKEKEKAKK